MPAGSRSVADLPEYLPGGSPGANFQAFIADPLRFHIAPYRTFGAAYRWHFGAPVLALAGLEANEFIYRHNDQFWDYAETMATFRDELGPRFLPVLGGEEHRKKRRRMNLGFQPKLVSPAITDMAAILHNEIAKCKGEPIDLRRFAKRVVVAMTSRSLLQTDLPDGTEDLIAEYERQLLSGGRHNKAWYQRPDYLALKKRWFDLLGRLVDERMATLADNTDIFSMMVKAHPADEPPIPRDELIGDLLVLFQAGSETTAHVILWSLLFLATCPAWAEELRQELAGGEFGGIKSMRDWPKLMATVFEVERLRPPFPFTFRVAGAPAEFQGIAIEPGMLIYGATSVTHFLEEIWGDPWTFRPQRFIENHTQIPDRALSIFGAGSHVCLGQPLARTEVPLAIATIFGNYDLALLCDVSMNYHLSGVVTPVQDELPVRFVKR